MLTKMLKLLLNQDQNKLVKVPEETDHIHKNVDHLLFMLKMIILT